MACVTSKCCFCAPLRPGLLVWAYLKLMLAVAFFVLTFVSYLNIFHLGRTDFLIHWWGVISLSLVYIVVSVIFIIGLHLESYKLLLVYYWYSMFEVLVGVSIITYEVVSIMVSSGMAPYYYRRSFAIIQLVVLILGEIVLPMYFIIVIRSELLAIKAQEEAAKSAVEDDRVVPDVTIAREQDKKYDFVYANPESQEATKMPLFPVEELEKLRQQLQQLEVKHV